MSPVFQQKSLYVGQRSRYVGDSHHSSSPSRATHESKWAPCPGEIAQHFSKRALYVGQRAPHVRFMSLKFDQPCNTWMHHFTGQPHTATHRQTQTQTHTLSPTHEHTHTHTHMHTRTHTHTRQSVLCIGIRARHLTKWASCLGKTAQYLSIRAMYVGQRALISAKEPCISA